MSTNSMRERIILSDVEILEAVSVIETVKRRMQGYEDLQQFAGPQFPVAAVVGGLPVPAEHKQGRNGQVDVVKSLLAVGVYVYFQENNEDETDSLMSDMVDDLWAALYADPTRGSLCLLTTIVPSHQYEVWPPYAAFKLDVNHVYMHNTGGI